MKKYKVKYDVVPGEFTKDELVGFGGADAVLIGSIIREESGWTSTLWYSCDGDTKKEFSSTEYFKAWVALAKKISEMPDALEWHKELTDKVFSTVKLVLAEMDLDNQ